MIPIAICDDELLHARQTQAAIRRCEAQAVTRCFETPLALLAAVTQQGYAPRVAVLDIRMAGMDGIELAKRLNALVPGCAVIFLTAYLSYAPDVYETRHVYFVLKSELDRASAAPCAPRWPRRPRLPACSWPRRTATAMCRSRTCSSSSASCAKRAWC